MPDSKYIDREISWLAFNERVLEEAERVSSPLLERVKFLAISASNIDEFYMVRVGGIHNVIKRAEQEGDAHMLEEMRDALSRINRRAIELRSRQQQCWDLLRIRLKQQGISFLTPNEYSQDDEAFLSDYIINDIIPSLSPFISNNEDDGEKFFLPSLSMAVLYHISGNAGGAYIYSVLPGDMCRFVQLPGGTNFALLDDIFSHFAPLIAQKMMVAINQTVTEQDFAKVLCTAIMRVIRNADLDFANLEEDAQDGGRGDEFVDKVRSVLKRRKRGEAVRVTVTHGTPEYMREFISSIVGVAPENVLGSGAYMLGLRSLMELYALNKPELKFTPYPIRFPERITDFGGDCFSAIAYKDIVIHHPYESFDVVVSFIEQASRDPQVVEIYQTLYRTSDDSPVIDALIAAAHAGKKVTAVVEVKARFDEETNLRFGEDLRKAGATVVYSRPHLKTHAKLSLVGRREGRQEVVWYAHYGTGNYHPETAQIYTDISFFTCNTQLCADAQTLFDYITNHASAYVAKRDMTMITEYAGSLQLEAGEEAHLPKFRRIVCSPDYMRATLLSLIGQEAENARAGKGSGIWLKMNALVDEPLIDALYDASQAGVPIELIVRGICCLRPQVDGLSENIRVKSVVGRFLEHSRIFCFGSGGGLPSARSKVYISSADFMSRNMDRRIEVMVPVENETAKDQLLSQIMMANLNDQKQSWMMDGSGGYKRLPTMEYSFCAHEYFMRNPSLSGRGMALQRATVNPSRGRGRRSTDRSGRHMATFQTRKVAVIDIGSNSVRLVIYDGLKRAPAVIFNEKRLCGLARDMEATGMLNAQAVEETCSVLARFLQIIRGMEVGQIFCIATSAVRDAHDGKQFCHIVTSRFGLSVRVLSGNEEARLATLGVASGSYEAKGVVGDLGGGSLELSVINFLSVPALEEQAQKRKEKLKNALSLGMDPENSSPTEEGRRIVRKCASFPIGALRLQSRIESAPQERRIKQGMELIHQYVKKYDLPSRLKGKAFYAVGGGFRAIAAAHIKRTKHPLKILQNYHADPQSLMKTTTELMNADPQTLHKQYGVPQARADSAAYSAMVLHYILQYGKPDSVIFSTDGVREGTLYDALPLHIKTEDALISEATQMVLRIAPPDTNLHDNASGAQEHSWIRFGYSLMRWMDLLFNDETHYMRRLRFACCLLSRIAWYENNAYRAEMAFRWVLDAELPAIDHMERVFIATALYYRYESRGQPSLFTPSHALLKDVWKKRARAVGIAMQVGYHLSGGASSVLQKTSIIKDGKMLKLEVENGSEELIDLTTHKRMKKLARVMGLKTDRGAVSR